MLVAGPTIQRDIVSIIVNWRFHRIGFIGDIQKMYLQVKVNSQDINYLRIVWRNDPSEPIQDFALNRLTFGTSSAAFIAIRSVNQLAEESKSTFPEAAVVMLNDAYVDDVLSGGEDVPTVQRLRRDLSEMMKAGGFNLKKWASNVNEVLESIPEADRELKLPIELNANDPIKALGIAWDTVNDSFGFRATLDDHDVKARTKRTALSTISKLFDPIGLVAPVVVIGKNFMAKVWAYDPKLGWDDPLMTSKSNKSVQLHGFSDASELAYGAAIYLRTVDSSDIVHVHLIASKSKVAPPKRQLTIPRLELNAAELLAQLLASIRRSFRHITVQAEDIDLWCDSEIVCYWLRSTKPLKMYVGNRVNKIRASAPAISWRHVRTHDNPADLVSRGVPPKELATSSLWWHGPSWLQLSADEWPVSRIDAIPSTPPENVELEHKREAHVNMCVSSDDIISRFSSYDRLMRVSAWCKRFAYNCSSKYQARARLNGNLTRDELQSVRRHWVLHTQRQHFYDEMYLLTRSPPVQLDHASKLLPLSPFVDGNGILRIGGRIEASMLPYDSVHPIILPQKSLLTELIINRFHSRAMHSGPKLTSSLIRQTFWIVNSRVAIRRHLHRCVQCFRQRANTTSQLMGTLPPARVRRTTRAFLHTGVDYCGPFQIRSSKGRGIKAYKGYVAVFVCLTVKAIHIECVDGLTTDAFLAAFNRFVARRGIPSDMYSDNGTNFVGAANKLERQLGQMKKEIENFVANKFLEDGVQWHFIPPGAPHFGGLWESGVKSVKQRLKIIIGETKFTFEQMQTFLCQIEACLNSRPLCENNDDPSDLSALTPGHFLVNTALLAVPEPSLLSEKTNRLDRWQQIQQMRQNFWKKWRDDYLSLLMQRPKWKNRLPNLNVGELVLVRDDRHPSCRWPLGRIVEVHPGHDEIVRVVTVRTAVGTYKRDITKISRLPLAYDEPAADEEIHFSANELQNDT